MHLASIPARSVRARHLFLQLAAAALLLAGCGGGGSAGPSSGGTGVAPTSFTAGHISGFGSIIVNGVRYDDSAALVTDDDGNRSSREALKLGMRVEIHGGGISDDGKGPRAAASEIRHGAELRGPVSAMDAMARTLVVLGQTVRVLDTTVIDERLVGGFAGIAVGAVLEVHGTLDAATGVYTATRLEPTGSGRRLQNPGHRVQPRQRRQDLQHRPGADLVRRRRAGAGQPGQRRADPGSPADRAGRRRLGRDRIDGTASIPTMSARSSWKARSPPSRRRPRSASTAFRSTRPMPCSATAPWRSASRSR